MTHASGRVLSLPSSSSSKPRPKLTAEQLFKVPTPSSSSPAATPKSHSLAPPRSTVVPSSQAPTATGSLRILPKAPPMEIRKAEVPSFSIPSAVSGKRSLMDAFGKSPGIESSKKGLPAPDVYSTLPALTKPIGAPRSLIDPISAKAPPPRNRPPPPPTAGMFIPKKKQRIPIKPQS